LRRARGAVMLRAEVACGSSKRAQGNAGRASRHPIRRSHARARGRRAGSPAGPPHRWGGAARRDADGARGYRRRGRDVSQPPGGGRHDDARVQDQLLRGGEIRNRARRSDAAPSRPAHSGLADARDRRVGPAAVAHDPDADGAELARLGALPSRKSIQPTTSASTANANDGVYEPRTSCTKPASAGPMAAPLRQPRPTTLMIVARAATPKTSETALTNVLAAPEAPSPNSSSAPTTVHVGSPIRSAASAPH